MITLLEYIFLDSSFCQGNLTEVSSIYGRNEKINIYEKQNRKSEKYLIITYSVRNFFMVSSIHILCVYQFKLNIPVYIRFLSLGNHYFTTLT